MTHILSKIGEQLFFSITEKFSYVNFEGRFRSKHFLVYFEIYMILKLLKRFTFRIVYLIFELFYNYMINLNNNYYYLISLLR